MNNIEEQTTNKFIYYNALTELAEFSTPYLAEYTEGYFKNGKPKMKKQFVYNFNDLDKLGETMSKEIISQYTKLAPDDEYLLSIDPGNVESAYCLIHKKTNYPILKEKVMNAVLHDRIQQYSINYNIVEVAIEMVACYGMAAGQSLFDTCLEIGRIVEKCRQANIKAKNIHLHTRIACKMTITHMASAKDSNIRQALMDSYGEVGTNNNRGWFYGFANDIWASYCVGIAHLRGAKEYAFTGKI